MKISALIDGMPAPQNGGANGSKSGEEASAGMLQASFLPMLLQLVASGMTQAAPNPQQGTAPGTFPVATADVSNGNSARSSEGGGNAEAGMIVSDPTRNAGAVKQGTRLIPIPFAKKSEQTTAPFPATTSANPWPAARLALLGQQVPPPTNQAIETPSAQTPKALQGEPARQDVQAVQNPTVEQNVQIVQRLTVQENTKVVQATDQPNVPAAQGQQGGQKPSVAQSQQLAPSVQTAPADQVLSRTAMAASTASPTNADPRRTPVPVSVNQRTSEPEAASLGQPAARAGEKAVAERQPVPELSVDNPKPNPPIDAAVTKVVAETDSAPQHVDPLSPPATPPASESAGLARKVNDSLPNEAQTGTGNLRTASIRPAPIRTESAVAPAGPAPVASSRSTVSPAAVTSERTPVRTAGESTPPQTDRHPAAEAVVSEISSTSVRATEISQQSADRLAEKQHSATASRIAPAAEPHAQGDSRDDSTGTDQANSRQQDVQRLTDGRVQTLPSQGTKTAFAAIISKTEAPAAGTLTGDALRSAVIDQIANAVHTKISEQSSEIRIALKPESLGEVSVRVRMDEGTMRAEINVQNASVKSVLELNLPALRDQLAARGIDLQQIEIVAGTQAQFQDSSAQSHTARQHTGPRRQQVSDAGGDDTDPLRSHGYNTMELVI